ncbi:MAG: bifunctional oligoribonuclease/PAP phosphatase NrnA [Elusimicrobiota bacterium]|nr:bifunctional oligoribonuclease/PAP phosphatase NrnA [Elusimicrobiota bacterium]
MLKVPQKYKSQLAALKSVLKNPKNKFFFVAGHQRPDGDTIGGCLAVYSLLRRLKKDVFLCNFDTVPSFLKFLPISSKLKNIKKTGRKFDVAIILECSELTRFGNIINPKEQSKITVNIDHHAYERKWADINWTDSCSSSVSEMIFYLFKFLELPLTKEEATSLYVGIVTDTHNFTQTNTNAQSHIIASELLRSGVEPSVIEKNIYGTKSLNNLCLLSEALRNIKIDSSGKIAYIQITNEDFYKTKTTPEDTEEIINYAGMIPNVLVWLLFREIQKKNLIKVSFRSVKDIDVNKIAGTFGGGGHRNAAGCTVKGKMEKVINTVISVVRKELKK